jgi:hypothetical protein
VRQEKKNTLYIENTETQNKQYLYTQIFLPHANWTHYLFSYRWLFGPLRQIGHRQIGNYIVINHSTCLLWVLMTMYEIPMKHKIQALCRMPSNSVQWCVRPSIVWNIVYHLSLYHPSIQCLTILRENFR